jgi:uncharacterized protein (DUF1501 family)
MKRRDFLRSMAIIPIIGRNCMAGSSVLAGMKDAYATNGKTLIVIFQRGGCDGLNTVVPYGEDEYYNLRPDIAIAAPGTNSESALDLDGFFGLHPEMTGLYDIFQQGDLAILPTVHYSDGNRSHFRSQDFIESGTPNQKLADGWLNRYLSSTQQQNKKLQALSFSSLAHAFQGVNSVATINSLSSHSDQTSASRLSILQTIFHQQVNDDNPARSLLHSHGSLALKNTLVLEEFSNSSYTVDNGATYPDSLYGQQLKDIAQLIKEGAGLEVATVSNNGWDHHANQGGAIGDQASKLKGFSDGIKALHTDLGTSYMKDVTILTISEFGRTAKQNASLGTDHGNASSWFVIGDQVNGGIYGDWPGLMPSQLYQDRFLAHTVNFTDVYAEILSRHLGVNENLSAILPGRQYRPIGFLS